ncbi:MAG: hypothetical protein NWT08_11420 [Akkermansiaceae bacterium]|jgi:hypothetical protein|nr:hypothetical protein [Akkermansiaceae bacterium]MDP4720912.1 hypothetical protein [Akkermansiaceae bacterium]MDP4780729.1 hypothetical protein [Akkermansiaceae bacterium]MDP4845675.1 hypothetical protein [Akkermansiaceae bacterium]MDP4898138.1 hypothetical protein [Akkermansiaceae bacterium]
MDARHPYEQIPLFTAGILLAVWLIASHSLMIAKPALVQGWLKKFPRNPLAGQIILGIALAWFWLLIAPDGMGKLSALQMDLGDFNNIKPLLRLLVPAALVAVVISVRDFLAVRALGVLGLMIAAPLLEAAFLKDPQSRLLVPIFAYALLTKSMFWVGMPYLFRDAVTWATATKGRWMIVSFAGLAYGIATLICAFAFWRGY